MSVSLRKQRDKPSENRIFKKDKKMVTIYNTTLSATSQRHFSDSLGGALGQRFRAEMSLKSVAEHSWGTKMTQCVA